MSLLSIDFLDFNPASPNTRALRASLRSMPSDNNRYQACIPTPRGKLVFRILLIRQFIHQMAVRDGWGPAYYGPSRSG
jgi:hypothetical protein